MTDKAASRRERRAALASLPADRHAASSAAIAGAVLRALDEMQRPHRLVAAFVGVRHEPDTRPLISQLHERGVAVALPRLSGPGTMQMHQIAPNRWHELESNPLGLREPPAQWPVIEPEAFDLVLVPGLAFAADGSRLGQGGGYYDRFLVRVERSRRWGLCVREVLTARPTWPVEPHDVPVGRVVTG